MFWPTLIYIASSMFNFIAVIKARSLKRHCRNSKWEKNIAYLLELVRRDRKGKILKVELLRL